MFFFHDNVSDACRKKVVDKIKNCFDLFIVLKSAIPSSRQRIEEYFSYGVHGLFFSSKDAAYSKEEVELMTVATGLFSRGWVYANSKNNKTSIKQLITLKIIPVLSEYDPELIDYIKAHKSFDKISPNIKTIPFLDRDQSDYSLADKIRMKMLLETMNLRQKLMVKNIDESFGSSGL